MIYKSIKRWHVNLQPIMIYRTTRPVLKMGGTWIKLFKHYSTILFRQKVCNRRSRDTKKLSKSRPTETDVPSERIPNAASEQSIRSIFALPKMTSSTQRFI